MQSLDGQARKWCKEIPARSVAGIEALDDIFLKYWGERRDHLYYITEFSNLKRENGESVSNFTKRFNNMYIKIPTEINPTKTLARITYANAFDSEFFLILIERSSSSLSLMQDASLDRIKHFGISKGQRKDRQEEVASRPYWVFFIREQD